MTDEDYRWLEECIREVGADQRKSRDQIDVGTSDLKGRINLVTEVDRSSENELVESILERHPEDGILAEEDRQNVTKNDRRWIIDPLDGTTNYVHSHPFYGISVALEIDSELTLGMAYFPELDDFYRASSGTGAFKNGDPLSVSETADPIDSFLATGFADLRADDETMHYNLKVFPEILSNVQGIRRGGSAVHDLCLVAEGVFDGFWEFNLEAWDVAAGAVLIREAGGTISDVAGGDGWLTEKNIVAGNTPTHAQLLEWLPSYLPESFPGGLPEP